LGTRADPSTQNLISELFDRTASSYGLVGPDFFSDIAGRLVKRAAIHSGDAVLDLATGSGAVIAQITPLVGQTGSVIGIDVSEAMLARARQRLARITPPGLNLVLRRMRAEQLEFDAASFDRVTCASALHLFDDPAAAVAEVRRVLRPRGRLAVSLFGAEDPRWHWKDELLEQLKPTISLKQRFDQAGLHELLTGAGFDAVHIDTEQIDVPYLSAEEWLASAWSHGWRHALERMDRDTLTAFRDRLPSLIDPSREHDDVYHWRPQIICAFADKP